MLDTERFICKNWDRKRHTCTFNKKAAMEFLNSVGAVIKNGPKRASVDPHKEWRTRDWERYSAMMKTLASGNGGLNLPTGLIACGEGDMGINQYCKQWTCEGKAVYEQKQKENPDSFILIRRNY